MSNGEPFELSREKLMEILRREDELRMSSETQRLYSTKLPGNDYMAHIRDVTIDLQKRAILDCGVPEEEVEYALEILHSHRYYYNDDPEVLQLSVYGRYDKCFDNTKVARLMTSTDIPLHTLEGNTVTLGSTLYEMSGPSERLEHWQSLEKQKQFEAQLRWDSLAKETYFVQLKILKQEWEDMSKSLPEEERTKENLAAYIEREEKSLRAGYFNFEYSPIPEDLRMDYERTQRPALVIASSVS